MATADLYANVAAAGGYMSTFPVKPGAGLRTVYTPFGYSSKGIAMGRLFRHPFYPWLGPGGVRFARGLVSYIEPTINGVPISGMVNGVQGQQPVLQLDPAIVAAGDNRSWACAEITVDSKGQISPDSTVVMAHRQTWFLQDPLGQTGRCPVCMILWNGKTPWQVFHILYFNATAVLASLNAGGATPLKQFFFI
ncbi:MAG TPA: hypothetical protein VHY22_00110 [Chthoniobacteraceae bacterium]|jgi:hypothetical protein|nr:hypothetical protein [Chthoniobacteraceae bacterium]